MTAVNWLSGICETSRYHWLTISRWVINQN